MLVDWNDDADYADTNEDVTAKVVVQLGQQQIPVQLSRGRDQIRDLAPPAAGALNFDLDNASRMYSVANPASPIAAYLHPGHLVRLQATNTDSVVYDSAEAYDSELPYDGQDWGLWTGFLDDLQQHPEPGLKTVSMPCLGSMSRLAGRFISTALYSSITTGAAIGVVLDALGWPSDRRQLSTGATTLDWWWFEGDPLQAILELLASEGPPSTFYEDGDGYLVFEDRNFRIVTYRSTNVQAEFVASEGDLAMRPGFSYETGVRNIVNSATGTQRARSAKASAVVWTLGASVVLTAGETRQYIARSSTGDPFQTALFVAATDYTVSAGSLTVATLSRTSGASTVITLTAGGAGATVTGLQVRAQPVTNLPATDGYPTTVTSTVNAAASIASYGLKTISPSMRAEMPFATMQAILNSIVTYYKDPRPILRLTIDNATAARTAHVLQREISDLINVIEPQTGVAAQFWIEHIGMTVLVGGFILATYGCEKVPTGAPSTWGTGIWGTTTWAT